MSSDKEDREIDKVIILIRRNIDDSGLNPNHPNNNRLTFWLLQVASACFAIILLTQTIALCMATEDKERMFECFSVLSFCSMGALKLKSLRTNFKQWSDLLIQLDSLEFEELNNERPEIDYESDDEDNKSYFVAHINLYTEKFRTLSRNVRRVYISTLIIFVISPFMEYIYWKLSTGLSVDYPHILPIWSPLDTVGFWGYLVTILAELLAAIYTVIVHLAFDIMVFGLIIFLCGQFELLRGLTESIGGRGMGYDLTPQRDARAHFRIIKCHRILVTLEKSVFELDELVQTILGIYFFLAMLTLCSVAVRLSSEEMSSMEVLSVLQYTGSCLTQLFLFCYYGDMLLHKSSVGMGEGVYASAWWRLKPRVRREALLLAAAQARVRRLRAGPFNRLDLPSFIKVVRAAYSYYAVLQK